jgi:hypothetical protein
MDNTTNCPGTFCMALLRCQQFRRRALLFSAALAQGLSAGCDDADLSKSSIGNSSESMKRLQGNAQAACFCQEPGDFIFAVP